ncbi:MAG: deoxyribonuclease IV [Solirubrobacterales bacterium]|nr:deoxyribonuclease IV [Solirubrobacterales bacterium]
MGAHVSREQPLAVAAELEAGCLQLFLSDPQSFAKPAEREDADDLRASDLDVYVHAPYLINVCSPRNNVRHGSRKILQQTCEAAAAIDAAAVIVHAGHAEDGIEAGVARWPRTLELLESEVAVLIENTAGGENAVGRRLDALALLWGAIGGYDGPVELGFCFDTCHAHAAGEPLPEALDRAREITGAIDLLHANDSRDPAGTGADRHANLGAGEIDPEALRAMIGAAGAPVVCETPGSAAEMRADLDFVRGALRR